MKLKTIIKLETLWEVAVRFKARGYSARIDNIKKLVYLEEEDGWAFNYEDALYIMQRVLLVGSFDF